MIDTTTEPFGQTFDSFGQDSGVALASTSGTINIGSDMAGTNGEVLDGLFDQSGVVAGSIFNHDPGVTGSNGITNTAFGAIFPATLDASALIGNIDIVKGLELMPSSDGNISLLAGGSITTPTNPNNSLIDAITMLDGTLDQPTENNAPTPFVSPLGNFAPTVLPASLHADDPNPVVVEAGVDISGSFSLIKPAEFEAGQDIINLDFTGMNLSPDDINSVIAGRDIVGEVTPGNTSIDDSQFTIFGPGTFLIQAGRNLGPFATSSANLPGGKTAARGIEAVGDGSNFEPTPISYLVNDPQSANVFALFGTGPGIDDTAAISAFINPADAGSDQGINFLPDIAEQLGVMPDQAWTTFQGLSTNAQNLLVDRAFLDLLTQVTMAFNDPASPNFKNPNEAFTAIETLFPAVRGFTNDAVNPAVRVSTGNLELAESVLETQTDGDINIIGPGGNVQVGTNSADPLANNPDLEGILTLEGGTINIFADGSIDLDKSRIFTEEGGDINIFSANGNIEAGEGEKTSAAFPPLTLICDEDGFCQVNPVGLVTGAGIGALISVPGQNPDDSNVDLAAPHGIIDAGAAGIRVAGNLNLVALQVLNAFNIDVQGVTIGIPTVSGPNVGALTSATNAAGAAQANVAAPAQHTNVQPSILIVEIEGYGGDDEPVQEPQTDQRKKAEGQHASYDPYSPVHLLGNGQLTGRQEGKLTPDERDRLDKLIN